MLEDTVRVSLTFRCVATHRCPVTGELRGKGGAFAELSWPSQLGGVHRLAEDEPCTEVNGAADAQPARAPPAPRGAGSRGGLCAV